MKLPRRVIAIAFAFSYLFQPAFGKSGTECFLGNCRDRGRWVACVTYDDATGKVLSLEGTMCDETHWKIDHYEVSPVSGKLRHSDYSVSKHGWQLKLDINADGRVAKLWMVDAHGMCWEAALDQASKL